MEENKTPSPKIMEHISVKEEQLRAKNPTKDNNNLIGGKNSLPKEKGTVKVNTGKIVQDYESTGKDKSWTERKGGGKIIPKTEAGDPTKYEYKEWKKGQEIKSEQIKNKVDKEAVRQSSTTEKTNVQNQSRSRGGRGGRGGGFKIPDPFMQMQKTTPLYRGKPLSEKEKLPFDEEQKENLQLAMEADKSEPINPFTQIEQEKEIAEPQIDNEIEQAETYNFQQIEDVDKVEVNLSEEEKENLAFAMSMDEENQFESFPETIEEIDQEMSSFEADNQLENLGEYSYQEQEEIDQIEPIVSDEWKENLMLAMEETEPEYEGFSE